METRTAISILVSLVFACLSASAQVSVNGVGVFTEMTKSEVISKFGEPDRYEYYDSGDNGVDEWYYYAGSHLVFNDSRFVEFSITDSKYTITLYGLEQNVRVDDEFSVIAPLNPYYMDWYEKDWYCVAYIEFDERVCFLVKDGLIKCVAFSTSSY
ncbi:MAG: hypothetical protein K2H10_02550 [Bacteroidales bacterium]|nr:hypothetical protein [Bacteroidales bacterium]